ncbi:hypothetical protein ACFQL1_23240 [Halomicroarcula sp. GCM10025709]|uniref:hypothetical protein n=1 Tax=Haloarcula TaxID=2237 RepID=UPI0030103948
MAKTDSRLYSLVWSQQRSRVRPIWSILVPIVVGFLALRLVGVAALSFDLHRGGMMVAAFGGTTLVMLGVIGISARYLDQRPVHEYGYRVSRDWWQDLVVGTVFGVLIVALAVVIAQTTGSLRVTSSTLVPDPGLLGWLLVFFAAFVGVAFYEEFIYRGSFITNAVEGSQLAVSAALWQSALQWSQAHSCSHSSTSRGQSSRTPTSASSS